MNISSQNIAISVVILSWVVACIFMIALILFFKRRPISLFNGVLLIATVGSILGAIILTTGYLNWLVLLGIIFAVLIGIAIIIAILSYFIGILLLWNAAVVWRREQHSLANSLTLLLGVYVLVSPLVLNLLRNTLPHLLYRFLIDIEGMIFFYLMAWLVCYGLSFFIYRFIRPKHDKAYLIVLGAGLLNGDQISPLLKRRVQRGLDFANHQYAKTGMYPYVIMSGGQGGDETIPEGVAMANYARSVGFPETQIIVEDQSKTTTENMQFSKEKILAHGFDITKGLFVTSDYHVFRAGIFAFDNGLRINGIGAKTRLYFLFNALIREFVAILARHKKVHLIVLGLIITFALVDVTLIPWLNNYR
ncbi:hypothetical protein WGH24286_00347 [Periweissella ghanensis]|uniref:DUF218 domain-containing protein n=2 Tax=Periweissella ghanensis TaxID=467997 RepID=A0ABN8BM86_9LACO|nr:hypothetical protein WGH24286_00347 [Periweissella ghanensis]